MGKQGEQDLFRALGCEAGCLGLAHDFYARVAKDQDLKPLFPGKTLRCATEEFAAFLVQFFDGDESQMQKRWWLSLRESHIRFRISEVQRAAWLGHMNSALASVVTDPDLRGGLSSFFEDASKYAVSSQVTELGDPVLEKLWRRQLSLDQLIEDLIEFRDVEAMKLASQHTSRRSVMVGIMARMMGTGREPLIEFVLGVLDRDPDLVHSRSNGRTPLHFAAGTGCLPVLKALLERGVEPNDLDAGGHAPLYRAANECAMDSGPQIVYELARSGAEVDHCGGVTRSTALHAAARHGRVAIALALVDEGASMEARDCKGFTPLDRARNCRRTEVATALEQCKPMRRVTY